MKETVNVAAMRKALEMAKNAICHQFRYNCQSLGSTTSNIQANCGDVVCAMRGICEAKTAINNALSAPPRNCDVGSPTKQAERFKRFCDEHTDSGRNPSCGMCPILPVINRGGTKELCPFHWGQMTCLETDGEVAE